MTDNQASDIPPMRYRGYIIIHLPSAEGTPSVTLNFAFHKDDSTTFWRWMAKSQASAMDQIDEIVGPR
jgi:hypothetical protein